MRRSTFSSLSIGVLAVVAVASWPGKAQAIPAFARKYGTSCQTCHTIYPKLTPFGEAFRRNGYMFPGKDSDFIKQETVPLGQDAYRSVFPKAVWPASLADSIPLAIGFNGQMMIHPDANSSAGKADNGTAVTFNDLVAEAHLWVGGSLTPHLAYFGEVTLSKDGVDIEHARIHWNDIVGPKHLFNLWVGRGYSTLTSFGAHSSYVADQLLPALGVTAMGGGTTDSWSVGNQYNGVELNGMGGGRFIYAIGVNAGSNLDIRPSDNYYAHLGFKLGGMRLDGEGDTKGDPEKPWAEYAFTGDVFGYRSSSNYNATGPQTDMTMPAPTLLTNDHTWLVGGALRLQLGSLELNSGVYQEWHDHAFIDATSGTPSGVKALAHWDELSYTIFPWFVPAVRFEYLTVLPDGGVRLSEMKIIPGIAMLVVPNVKVTAVAQIEIATGGPADGSGLPTGFTWAPSGASAVPMPGQTVKEIESITVGAAYAF